MFRISFGFEKPKLAELEIPATAALVQENVTPEVELAGVYLKVVPLQIAGGANELVNSGLFFTVTATLYVVGPVQDAAASE